MLLQFDAPFELSQNFEVPIDATVWDPQTHLKVRDGWTPARDRATYGTWRDSLVPNGQYEKPNGDTLHWEDVFGLYLFAGNLPSPSLYIGIASQDAKTPEGVLVRLKKHRVKATGSHVGGAPDTVGGVKHMQKWRIFAAQRYATLGGIDDTLADVRIVLAQIENVDQQPKSDLERFESSMIVNQGGVLDDIVARLWPGLNSAQVRLLNGTSGGFELTPDDQIHLW